MFNNSLIMAGGAGTRLWPASSSRLPKQFLPVGKKNSFFLMSLKRALALTQKKGKVIIITGVSHIPHVIKDAQNLSNFDKKRLVIIGEPIGKNTAPAIACAVVFTQLFNKDPVCRQKDNMLVLTSDHIINPLKTFKSDASLAAAASIQGKLVVFGIPPTRPETGYGYIEAKKNTNGLCEVAAFHEKPDLKKAKKYFAAKNFFWNSGMFAFSTQFITEQFRKFAPEVLSPFEKLKTPKISAYKEIQGIQVLNSWAGINKAYNETKGISFDYAIAEKCSNTAMIRTNFDWIDIGNWEEYVKVCTNNNTQVFFAPPDGSPYTAKKICENFCYVDSDIPVAIAGADDLIVVIRSGKDGSPASALITKKGQTQKVRDIVELIKKSGKTELL